MMRTRCEVRGEEGHMLDAGRCEGYTGGAGGVGMQADAERTVQIDRASCASEGERTDAGRGETGEERPLDIFRKIVGRRWPGWVDLMLGVSPLHIQRFQHSISLHMLLYVER